MRLISEFFLIWLVLQSGSLAITGQNTSPSAATNHPKAESQAQSGASATRDPALLFQHGQDALNRGRLDQAEHDFRQVLALNPQMAGAYANLGVVYMRRKQWAKALEMLQQAEHMLPQ